MAESKMEASRPVSSPSPPPNCAICLGQYTNKCFSDSCMHQFCFRCLLEWSKIKAECPLCKQPFKSIIHNVKSNNQYDEHVVESNLPTPYVLPVAPTRQQFHFRTTFTVDARGEHAIQQMLLTHPLTSQSQFRIFGSRRRRGRYDVSTTSFRRSIYNDNLWVNAPPDVTGRYRDVSPAYFRNCPAARTRLAPWLNRELNALLLENTQLVMHLVDLIMEFLLTHHICSSAFRNLLNEYLAAKTDHFVHEFYNFMRSPFDMYGYDRHIVYTERPHSPTPFIDVSDNDSDDSDVILVSASIVPEVAGISEPVVIDLIETDSDEPVLVSVQEAVTEEPALSDADEAAARLPLKLRLKHKRQSRQKRRKKHHAHRASSNSSDSSSSSSVLTSSSNDSSDAAAYKRYKRKRRLRKKNKKRDVCIISSEKESNDELSNSIAIKPKSESEDDIPLAAFAAKKDHHHTTKQKKKKQKKDKCTTTKSPPPQTVTTTTQTTDDHSIAGCSSSMPMASSSRYFNDSPTMPSMSYYGQSTLLSSDIMNLPSCSKYYTADSYATIDPSSSTTDFPSIDTQYNFSYADDEQLSRKPAVKSEIREVNHHRADIPSNGKLNILIKKEESSNNWFSYPCKYNYKSDSSD